MADPSQTDPDKYTAVFENERVRVLEYRDEPGAKTSPHNHPDSVMKTTSRAAEDGVLAAEEDIVLASEVAQWRRWFSRFAPTA